VLLTLSGYGSRMTTQWAAAVASNLRAELARANRRKGDLAAVLGLSPAAITRRASGETPLDVNELFAIAEWLDIPVTALLPDEGYRLNKSGLSWESREVFDGLLVGAA